MDGSFIAGENGRYFFELESEINASGTEIRAGQTLELLRSATLEKMAADAQMRSEAKYRLWGKVTKFGGKNYVFAVYFLGLRKINNPVSEPTQGIKQTINAPNDVVNIPAEIIALLKTSEVLPTIEVPEKLLLKQDTIFASRVGRVVEKAGKYVFEPDGLGRGVEKFEIELLPCQALEQAIEQVRSEPNPVRFNVAGIWTKYKDGQYLLPQKAIRMYSYGNFGR